MNQTIYFMSIMLRRKHPKATRILASYSLGIGSKYRICENFKPIVLKYLNIIFDKTIEIAAQNMNNSNFNDTINQQLMGKSILTDQQIQAERNVINQICEEMFALCSSKKVQQLIPRLNFMERKVSSDLGIHLGSNTNVAQTENQENQLPFNNL